MSNSIATTVLLDRRTGRNWCIAKTLDKAREISTAMMLVATPTSKSFDGTSGVPRSGDRGALGDQDGNAVAAQVASSVLAAASTAADGAAESATSAKWTVPAVPAPDSSRSRDCRV